MTTALLAALKARFDKEITVNHIEYAWDSGHCYSSISRQPLMDEVEQMNREGKLSQDEYYEWEDYTNGWLSEHEDMLYCVPNLINILAGSFVGVGCSTCPEAMSENPEPDYIEGFIKLAKKEQCYSEYLPLLEKWLAEKRDEEHFNEKLDSELNEE